MISCNLRPKQREVVLRLLVVSEWFPYPPIAGAKIRAYNLIRQLARLAELDLVAQVRTLTPDQLAAGTAHLSQFCRTRRGSSS